MHVTVIDETTTGFRWSCTCGKTSPISFPNRPAAVRAAWAHRTLANLESK